MGRMVDGMDGIRKYGIFGLFHLDRLKSLNVKIDLIRLDWIGGDIWRRHLLFGKGIRRRFIGGGIWRRYLE